MIIETAVLLGLNQVLLGADVHGGAVEAAKAGRTAEAAETWGKFLEGLPQGTRTLELSKACGVKTVGSFAKSAFSPYLPLFIVKGADECYHICFGLSKKGEAMPKTPDRLRSKLKARSEKPVLLSHLLGAGGDGSVITQSSLEKYRKRREAREAATAASSPEEGQAEEVSGPKLPEGFEPPPPRLTHKELRAQWKGLQQKAYNQWDDATEEYENLKEEIRQDRYRLSLPNVSSDRKEAIRSALPAKEKKLKELEQNAKKALEARTVVDSAAQEAVDTGELMRP